MHKVELDEQEDGWIQAQQYIVRHTGEHLQHDYTYRLV